MEETRRRPLGSRPWWLAWVVALLAAAGMSGIVLANRTTVVVVRVEGREVNVGGPRPTVAAALEAAGRVPRHGALRSARTGRVLDANAVPARIVVDGVPAPRSRRLAAGAEVTVIDGLDAVEATEVKQVEVPAPPGPDVETLLWYPGTAGVDEVTAGVVSGEVVTSRRIAEPVPPRREEGNVVALTFDDGPSPTWTPQVLQILAEEAVPATFCMVGDMVRKRPEVTRAIAAAGHAVCAHTMNHPDRLDQLSPEDLEREVGGGAEIVAATTGRPVTLFRAPAGRTSPAVLEAVGRRGMRLLDWTIDGQDVRSTAAVLLERVLSKLRPGAVVLLHDGGGVRSATVEMLRPLIQTLKAQGWQFATPLTPPPPPPPP